MNFILFLNQNKHFQVNPFTVSNRNHSTLSFKHNMRYEGVYVMFISIKLCQTSQFLLFYFEPEIFLWIIKCSLFSPFVSCHHWIPSNTYSNYYLDSLVKWKSKITINHLFVGVLCIENDVKSVIHDCWMFQYIEN